jgi:hypothetical protein
MANAGCGCAALAADAFVVDDEVPGDLAVQGLHLEHQVLALELLLERRVVTAGLGHQQPHGPEKKAKLHQRASIEK